MVCSACLMRLPFAEQVGCCRLCGRSVPGFEGEFVCGDCETHRPAFDRAASALRYEGEARTIIKNYKFNNRVWLREDLADWLDAAARARLPVTAVDAVLPMPLSAWHRLDRGYNQSALLAASLARRLDRAFLPNALRRIGNPKRQSELPAAERYRNAAGTFAVSTPTSVRGRTILLVDDIMTTGATLSAAAAALKDASAAKIFCITLARSLQL